jgi:hypothetical protein
MERFDVGDPRVFASSAAIGPALIIGIGLKRDAEPLDARWIAGFIENYACYANARIVILCHQPREEVQFPIRPTNGRGIQNTLNLLGISRLGFHKHR